MLIGKYKRDCFEEYFRYSIGLKYNCLMEFGFMQLKNIESFAV